MKELMHIIHCFYSSYIKYRNTIVKEKHEKNMQTIINAIT